MAVKKEVSIEAIKKAERMLSALPAKEPEKKLISEALLELKPQIEAALTRGYSREDVVDLLTKQGLPVKVYHLKSLLTVKRVPGAPETPAT